MLVFVISGEEKDISAGTNPEGGVKDGLSHRWRNTSNLRKSRYKTDTVKMIFIKVIIVFIINLPTYYSSTIIVVLIVEATAKKLCSNTENHMHIPSP